MAKHDKQLLAACKSALAEIERLYTGQPRKNFNSNPTVKQLRAAIAKAEKGTQ